MKAVELKEKIKKKELTIGFQQFVPSPQITEIAGLVGYDWLWFCIEHGPAGYGTELENCIRAAGAVGMVPMVRITDPTAHFMYMKVFEAGAKGVIVPLVRTKKDVIRAVEEVRFPPHGLHGFCPAARRWQYGLTSTEVDLTVCSFPEEDPYGYLNRAEEECFVVPIIETREAVDNLDKILSVEGIDFVIWGHLTMLKLLRSSLRRAATS